MSPRAFARTAIRASGTGQAAPPRAARSAQFRAPSRSAPACALSDNCIQAPTRVSSSAAACSSKGRARMVAARNAAWPVRAPVPGDRRRRCACRSHSAASSMRPDA
ncbi:hypothetical protein LP419_39875 [Massilia sp. H-1]|nr:hypothetical protein LP419_39875 [Massilia sp. H-1]